MSSDVPGVETADTMRGRAGASRLKLWILMGSNRFVILAVLALSVFVAFVAASSLIGPSLRVKVASTDTIDTLFSTMIGVLVTGTTLVVTINQIILSQENGPLGDQRRRMSGAMDFREYTSDLLGTTAPVEPSALLAAIVEESTRRAETLQGLVSENDDADLRDAVDRLFVSIRDNSEAVRGRLDGAEFGTFDVVFAALDYDYSRKIYGIERTVERFESSLDEDERAAFDDLETAVVMFGPAREHVKTLYFQWALVDLSQYILYAAVPALVVAGCMLTFVGAESFPGTTFGVPDITWIVGAAFTVSLVPFLLFTSYILRIATVAKRTLAIGPLILRSSGRTQQSTESPRS